MGKSHNKKQKKKPAKKAIKNTSKPFRFLDLLPEIRRVVYRHHFAGVSVLIQESTPDDDHADQMLEDVVAFCSRFTDLQDDDTDEKDDHYESEGELITSQEIRALSENKWRDVYSDNEDRDQIKIHSAWAARLGWLLLTCKQIRDEAQPILGASVHLKVLEDTFEVQDLPKFCQHLYLSRIQQVTLQTIDEYPERYSHRFDVRQMPNLKTLHLWEAPTQHSKYVLGDVNPDTLVGFVHGEKDSMFIRDWFEREAKITQWEDQYASRQESAVQQLLKEKNDVRFWARQIMFKPNERKFNMIYRRYLTLTLQTLWPDGFAPGRVPNSVLSEARGRVFVDLEFDVDTKQVVGPRVRDINHLDLSDKADLKCYIRNEIPEHVKKDVRELMGGNPTDSEIEDFMESSRDEMDSTEGTSRFQVGWFDQDSDDEDYDNLIW